MAEIAFLFSGQGAQRAGMGREFYASEPEVRRLFDAAEKLRPGTLEQCFSGDAAALARTENTQPCLYLADAAAAIALEARGVHPRLLAGFSLGELAALACAGSYTWLEGFEIVCRRAELMQRAAQGGDAAMFAVLRLDAATVISLCEGLEGAWPVNFNSPGQTVVSCLQSAEKTLSARVRGQGGRLMRLAVGGAFHSPLMAEAARRFESALAARSFRAPRIPVYANRTAAPYGQDIAATLASQMDHPVLWEKSLRAMAAEGIDTFIECGVGNTLQKIVSRVLPEAQAFAVGTPEEIPVLCIRKEEAYAFER